MKETIKKEILYDLQKALDILERREEKDVTDLEQLSEHAITDVAVHKDIDLVSVSVLIYSLFKIGKTMPEKDYQALLRELRFAREHLQKNSYGRYNSSIKTLFALVRKCNAPIKEHLQDVLDAARIKKSASLFKRGLSIGQAAGIMGLSNWDLQSYVGKTVFPEEHQERFSAGKRLRTALRIFGVGA